MNNLRNLEMDTLGESIISENLTKLTKDLLEVGLDSFLENGILRDIPIIGSFSSIAKIGIGIRDKIFAKKILMFLFEIKDIPFEKRKEFTDKINSNSEYSSKVGETILLIIDKLDDIKKAELIGKLFVYSINGIINYKTFLRLSIIIERCFLEDLSKLELYYNGKQKQLEVIDKHILYNLGLLINLGIDGTTYLFNPDEEIPKKEIVFKISEYGRLIVELLLQKKE